MTFAQLQTENRRLYLLKTLKLSADYRMSDMLLQSALTALGYGASLAVIRGDIAWLEQQGLLSTEAVPGMTLAKLSNEGVDVADGVSHTPGIARPRPE